MAVTKDPERGTWTVQCWHRDWQGARRKKTKRSFKSRASTLAWERDFAARSAGAIDMRFGDFFDVYTEDVTPRLKLNTWLSKEHMVRTKTMPYFEDKAVNAITPADIVKCQNELLAMTDGEGRPYSPTYLHSITNQMSAIMNHAVRLYGLRSNPMHKVERIGSKRAGEMLYWTKDEYLEFSREVMDKPDSFLAFEVLYWTGVRVGELLALTPANFDLDPARPMVSITKSYQRLQCRDVVTSPKTKKSERRILMPRFLADEVRDHLQLFPKGASERVFAFTKGYLHHKMDRGSRAAGVKRIRIHDLRHSHVSLLIDMGYSAVAIADRLGHESSEVTLTYAHMFPSVQTSMAADLEKAEGKR